MVVHIQDEQEVANFKYFWQRWGRWIFAILVILSLAYLGYVLYQSHLRSNDEKAAVIFETFVTQAGANNMAESKKALIQLQEKYPETMNTTQATLMMAGSAFDDGKYDEAIRHLQWVKARQHDDLLQTIVAQRLASVYLQQSKYNEALQALDVKVTDAFKPVLLETKGDVLQAQKKNAEAVAIYQQALNLLSKDSVQREFIQLKISSLS
ncbi:tetratricopeptide repeat protein [Snodgrassella sp. ESL0323]|uniref:YfgM family protein n=1 Tax=Snodgrassella sp. ESL0323 TaxID=2705034 RepID=UPI0015830C78|nr:tetratricopeptide repeat protein [Snodgrassella sp. ESL0323]NUF78515.1 tetratricopeptide repeat protein [Snodgrassella sp. ESL0323]